MTGTGSEGNITEFWLLSLGLTPRRTSKNSDLPEHDWTAAPGTRKEGEEARGTEKLGALQKRGPLPHPPEGG